MSSTESNSTASSFEILCKSPETQSPPSKMSPLSRKVKLAAVQAEPVWNDLQGSVDKVISLIKEAGKNGAQVMGFPEVFIPGYPWSIWTESVFKNIDFIHEYMANSMARESPEMDRIRDAVKEAGMFVVLGYSERAGSSLYIAQVD